MLHTFFIFLAYTSLFLFLARIVGEIVATLNYPDVACSWACFWHQYIVLEISIPDATKDEFYITEEINDFGDELVTYLSYIGGSSILAIVTWINTFSCFEIAAYIKHLFHLIPFIS